MDHLGERIRIKREKQNITLDELSAKTKISVAVLKDIEDGKFDRYEGDEAYVKMYLKKISQILDMDSMALTQEYVALTQEIELSKIQEEMKDQQEVVKKGKEFRFKVPQLTRKPSVYEDRSHLDLIRAGLILLLVCLIVVVLWYGFSSTRQQSEKPHFEPNSQSHVEGVAPPSEEVPNVNNPTSPQGQNPALGMTYERKNPYTYEFKLPEGTQKISMKFEFNEPNYASLRVNGVKYKDFVSKTYASNGSESVELEFDINDFNELELKNGHSKGHRYYINGQELVLDEQDISDGVTRLKLILVKE